MSQATTQTNFGGNQSWRSVCYRPRDAEEVKKILELHRDGHVRCFGAKHSWSGIAGCDDVSVDMALFDSVELVDRGDTKVARVGAGCTLQALLDRLHATSDQTLPSLGAIKRQTIAGVISTATHGSGTQSLSHFVEEIELAAYDENGRPAIFVHRGGPALAASRCALGCMGIILRVDLRTVPRYWIREEVKVHAGLGDVIAQYGDYPLTQLSFTPYRWDYLAFQRRRVEGGAPSLRTKALALLFRLYMRVVVDFAVHFGVWLAIRLGPWAVKGALKLAPSLLRFIRRTDYAEEVLTQKHDLFRHEEMELFVPESQLAKVAGILRWATEVFAGSATPIPESVKVTIGAPFHEELLAARGSYTHHYPFFFRRVLPDGNTLVSMTASSEEPYFSIGVFTYYPPDRRDGYYTFCSWLARCLHAQAGARLHWGKHFPLEAADMARVYPELELFRDLCASADPRGVFTNPYAARVLGLPQRGRPERKAAA
jgi:L-gulonolactone oxidase